MSSISIRIVSEPDELSNLGDVWDDILNSSANNKSIYLTHEWISTMWRHFGGKCKLNIVLIQKDNRTIGIFPLQKVNYRLGMLRFTVLETIGVVNCNYVGLFSTESASVDEVMDAFFTYLINEVIDSNLIIRFKLVPDDCTIIRPIHAKLSGKSAKLLYDEKTETIAPYIPITTEWNTYLSSLGKQTRRNLRRLSRRAESDDSIVYGRFHHNELDRGLNYLFDLHIKRWQPVNIKSQFTKQEHREFYRDIAIAFIKRNWLHFSYLMVNCTISCVMFAYTYDNKLYDATVARDISQRNLDAGCLHYLYLIKEAFQNGFREFDFLRGDEAYKFFWTDKYRKYLRLIFIKRTPLSRLRMFYIKICLFLIQVITNKHSFRELMAIILLNIKNRKLKRQMPLKP